MSNIAYIASKMSPDYSSATLAVAAGDDSTDMLHAARQEVARFTDRMVGRGRRNYRPGRVRMIETGRAAYDAIAAQLTARGAL